MDWIDTSTSGYQNRPDGAIGGTWYSGPGSEIRFKDITKHKDLCYIIVDIEGDRGHWLDDSAYMESGVHYFSYTYCGNTRPGVVYVSRSTNVLGSITATHFTIFLNEWDIGDATGTQLVYLPFYVFWGMFSDKVNSDYPDVYIASVTAESQDTQGRKLPGIRSAPCKTICVSGSYWENRLKVDRSDIGYNVNLERIIPGNPYKHASTIYLNLSDDIVYHEYGIENLVLWYPDIDIISIISPQGKTYTFPLVEGGDPGDPGDPGLTVYIKNSQTGALIANSNIIIDALVNDEYYPVVNRTEPSGIFSISLQPTGGGPPNPDGYRLIVTADGYNNPMPEINFTVDDYKQSIYCLLDPIAGGPANENKTFIDFFVHWSSRYGV